MEKVNNVLPRKWISKPRYSHTMRLQVVGTGYLARSELDRLARTNTA